MRDNRCNKRATPLAQRRHHNCERAQDRHGNPTLRMQNRENETYDRRGEDPAQTASEMVEQRSAEHRLFDYRGKDTRHTVELQDLPPISIEHLSDWMRRSRAGKPDQNESREKAKRHKRNPSNIAHDTGCDLTSPTSSTVPPKRPLLLKGGFTFTNGPIHSERKDQQGQPLPI